MHWLFVGSSPTAPYALPIARGENIIDRIITCNSGLKLIRPDVYFCSDYIATFAFQQQAREIQSAGTHLVSIDRPEPLRECHHTEFYDEFIVPGDDEPTLGHWGSFYGSGPFCMEYALRHGATRLVLVGCEGYVHGDGRDYFDGAELSRLAGRVPNGPTLELLQPRINQLARIWQDTEFICYGRPHYRVTAPNWRVVELLA